MDPITLRKLNQHESCLNAIELLVDNIDRFLLQLQRRSEPDYEQAMNMIDHEIRIIKTLLANR